MALPSFETVDDETLAWLKNATIAERLAMMNELHNWARQIIADETRTNPPDTQEAAVADEVARRFLFKENLPELFAKDLLRKRKTAAPCPPASE